MVKPIQKKSFINSVKEGIKGVSVVNKIYERGVKKQNKKNIENSAKKFADKINPVSAVDKSIANTTGDVSKSIRMNEQTKKQAKKFLTKKYGF